MSERRVLTILLSCVQIAGVALLLSNLITGNYSNLAINGGLFVVTGGILIAHLLGWAWSAHTVVAVIALVLTGLAATGGVSNTEEALTLIIPAILAGVFLPWYWCVAVSVPVLLAALIGSTAITPSALFIVSLEVAGVALAAFVARRAQAMAEANAKRASGALARAEAQSAELAHKAEELEAQNLAQRQLLDLVTTLETPAVALAEGVLLAPVVGHLDSRRADSLTDRLLREVSAQRARLVVLDIAGVAAVDTAVAQALLKAVQAVRLLGCDVVMTGISASIAATMTQLGINMSGVRTARTPQEALEQAMFQRRSGAPAPGRPTPN